MRQTTFQFTPAKDLPAERVAELRAKLAAVRARTARPRVESFEDRGRASLEAPPAERAKRPYTLRVYYRSMAGELLAAEFSGLTMQAADRFRMELSAGFLANDRKGDGSCAVCFPESNRSDPSLKIHHARLVVFPSEIPGGVIAPSEIREAA
jgi:anti-sigma factor RsiW